MAPNNLGTFSLADRRCLLVGANTGIGRATARYFISGGARVALASMKQGAGATGVGARDAGDVRAS